MVEQVHKSLNWQMIRHLLAVLERVLSEDDCCYCRHPPPWRPMIKLQQQLLLLLLVARARYCPSPPVIHGNFTDTQKEKALELFRETEITRK